MGGAWIGGEWQLPDHRGEPPLAWSPGAFLAPAAPAGPVGLFGSGRAALRAAIEALGGHGTAVLLPAYGCLALTQAALQAGARPVYYPGDGLARPLWTALDQLAAHHDAGLAVLVHAFGVLQDGDAARQLVLRREDCSHTLCNASGSTHLGPEITAAAVASLRKLLPIPSGGLCALWAPGHLPAPSGSAAFAQARTEAFALPPGPERCRRLQACEQLLDHIPAGELAPDAAAALASLAAAPESALQSWRQRTRRNREALASALDGSGCRVVHAQLPAATCPPGLLLRHPDRTRLAARLLAGGVEAVLHWPPTPAATPHMSREERLLAASALTLPCDGRWTEPHMLRVAAGCRPH